MYKRIYKSSAITACALALVTLAITARADEAAVGVRESTDPGRAAAVERAAREMQARSAAAASQPGGSAYIVEGTTDAGLAFLSGGVTADDRKAMSAARGKYNLWVATVAKPSGAYLTGARLRIVDASSGDVVVERRMDGPWFMLALPPGAYEVSATYGRFKSAADQTLSRRVTVASGGPRQEILRFDSTADVETGASTSDAGAPGS